MKTLLSVLKKRIKNLPFITLITFVLSIGFFLTIAPISMHAAGTTSTTEDQSSPGKIYLNYSKDGKQEGFVPNLMTALIENIMGVPDSSTTAVGTQNSNTSIQYKGGAMQTLAGFSSAFYDEQPASFVVWAQDQYYQLRGGLSFTAMAAQANPNDTTSYAPGAGYNVLTPIIGLWEYSRNLVYGVYVIIFILLAFLILLRRPLGGQEVITIANSLPSLVISIILVTFSYPICGLFIDAVYLGSNLAYNIMFTGDMAPGKGLSVPVTKYDSNGNELKTKIDIKNVIQPDDPQMSIWSIMNLSGANICDRNSLLSGLTTDDINKEAKCSFGFIVPKQASNMMLGGTMDTIAKSLLNSKLAQTGVSILIELILALAMFQTALKLFFNLLNSYITLSVYPIISPWIFLSAAIPNNLSKALDGFLKTLGAASLNFVVIYACFLLLVIFGQSSAGSQSGLTDAFNRAGQFQWVPPLLGYSNQQIMDVNSIQNNGGNIITSLLIFGLFMAIPNISEMIKKFLEVASPFQQLAQTGGDITKVGKQALGTIGAAGSMIGGRWFGGK